MFGDHGVGFSSGLVNTILYLIIIILMVWIVSRFHSLAERFKPLLGWYYDLSYGLQKFFRIIFYFIYIAACFMLMVYISS